MLSCSNMTACEKNHMKWFEEGYHWVIGTQDLETMLPGQLAPGRCTAEAQEAEAVAKERAQAPDLTPELNKTFGATPRRHGGLHGQRQTSHGEY